MLYNYTPAKGHGPLDSHRTGHSALHFSRPQRQISKGSRQQMAKRRDNKYTILIALRVSPEEKNRLQEQAGVAGLSVSEYLRRRFFGGRPIMAWSDDVTIKELRRIGGLLKYNFETIRQASGKAAEENASDSIRTCLEEQEYALRTLTRTLERIGLVYRSRYHDSQES